MGTRRRWRKDEAHLVELFPPARRGCAAQVIQRRRTQRGEFISITPEETGGAHLFFRFFGLLKDFLHRRYFGLAWTCNGRTWEHREGRPNRLSDRMGLSTKYSKILSKYIKTLWNIGHWKSWPSSSDSHQGTLNLILEMHQLENCCDHNSPLTLLPN